MNFVTVAQFFHITCVVIMDHFIVSIKQDSFLGPISHYYYVVETNGRGILYLHYILWLSGNFDWMDIRTQLLEVEAYTYRIIIYLNTIILYYIDETILQTSTFLSNKCISPFTRECKSNSYWLDLINHSSNADAAIK